VALHLLLHLDEAEEAMTSESLGPMLGIHPVVVRRTMAGLRDAGIVHSEKGHGGGWSLSRTLSSITLGDVYDVLGVRTPFSIGPRVESPGCLVEQAVNHALNDALQRAESALQAQLRTVSLADLAAEVCRKGGLPIRQSTKKGCHLHV